MKNDKQIMDGLNQVRELIYTLLAKGNYPLVLTVRVSLERRLDLWNAYQIQLQIGGVFTQTVVPTISHPTPLKIERAFGPLIYKAFGVADDNFSKCVPEVK